MNSLHLGVENALEYNSNNNDHNHDNNNNEKRHKEKTRKNKKKSIGIIRNNTTTASPPSPSPSPFIFLHQSSLIRIIIIIVSISTNTFFIVSTYQAFTTSATTFHIGRPRVCQTKLADLQGRNISGIFWGLLKQEKGWSSTKVLSSDSA